MDLTPSSPSSRRAFLGRSALVGAAVWVVPAAQIVSMTGLTAASASSHPTVQANLPGLGNQGQQTVVVPGDGSTTVVVNPGQKDTGVIITPGQQGQSGVVIDPGSGKATVMRPGDNSNNGNNADDGSKGGVAGKVNNGRNG